MSLKGQLARTSWALIDQSLISVANFAIGVLAVRFLGIDEFGIYSLVVIAMFFANGVQSAFISTPMSIISQKIEKEKCNVYYCTVFGQQIVLGLALIILVLMMYVASNALNILPRVKQLAYPFVWILLATQLQEFLRRYFVSLNHLVKVFWLDLIKYLAQFSLLYWFSTHAAVMRCDDFLWALCWGTLFSGAIFIAHFKFAEINTDLLVDSVKRHWSMSRWLGLTALVQWFTDSFPVIVVGAMLGAEQVGILKASQNILGGANVIIQTFESVVPVAASRVFHISGKDGLTRYLKKVASVGTAAMLVLGVCFATFPEYWLYLIYGAAFDSDGFAVRWYAAILCLIVISMPIRIGLTVIESPRLWFYAYLVMALFLGATIPIFVHEWGLFGCLLDIFISLLVLVIVSAYFLRGRLKDIAE